MQEKHKNLKEAERERWSIRVYVFDNDVAGEAGTGGRQVWFGKISLFPQR